MSAESEDSGLVPDVFPSRVESVPYEAAFPISLTRLVNAGYEIISLAQTAYLRVAVGENAVGLRDYGHFVREGFLYRPGEKTRLVMNSPILSFPNEVAKAHGKEQEFYLNEGQLEIALSDSIEVPEGRIPTKHFGGMEFTNKIFGGDVAARGYGEFLHDMGMTAISVDCLSDQYISKVGKTRKAFVRQAFFDKAFSGSTISGHSYSSHIQTWRGILQVFK